MSVKQFLFIACVALVSACTQKNAENKKPEIAEDDKGPYYFSMKDFVLDQWNVFHGQPYTFLVRVTKDGKTDSSYVDAFKMELGALMETFNKTDIGEKKFLDKYRFNVVDDNVTFTRNYYYEAIDPTLYTKVLQVMTDPTNNKIKSVYVEASDDKKELKLYYAPHKIIQVQEFKKANSGLLKEVKTEYRFPQAESSFE